MKFKDATTKKDRIAIIRAKLTNDPRWVIRGLLAVYANQTRDEQTAETVKYENGVGFTGADGEILSSFAKQVEAGRQMSPKQMALLFRKMPKYARQLEAEARANEPDVEVVERMMHEAFHHAEMEAEANAFMAKMNREMGL